MPTTAEKKTKTVVEEVVLRLTPEDAAALYALTGRSAVPAADGRQLTRNMVERVYGALHPLFRYNVPGDTSPIPMCNATADACVRELVAKL
jgi:hypothetical protein